MSECDIKAEPAPRKTLHDLCGSTPTGRPTLGVVRVLQLPGDGARGALFQALPGGLLRAGGGQLSAGSGIRQSVKEVGLGRTSCLCAENNPRIFHLAESGGKFA